MQPMSKEISFSQIGAGDLRNRLDRSVLIEKDTLFYPHRDNGHSVIL